MDGIGAASWTFEDELDAARSGWASVSEEVFCVGCLGRPRDIEKMPRGRCSAIVSWVYMVCQLLDVKRPNSTEVAGDRRGQGREIGTSVSPGPGRPPVR